MKKILTTLLLFIVCKAFAQSDGSFNTLQANRFLQTSGFHDLATGATVSTSGGFLTGGGPQIKTSDSKWYGMATGDYITIDVYQSITISYFTFGTWFNSDGRFIPKGYTLSYSNDNITYTNAFAPVTNNSSTIVSHYVGATGRYWRLTIDAFQDGWSANISGIQLLNAGWGGAVNGNYWGNNFNTSKISFMGGNVGIGVTDPSAMLHIAGGIKIGKNSSINVADYGHSSGNDNTVSFGQGGGTIQAVNYFEGAHNHQYLAFTTHHGGTSIGTRMVIDRDGKVGIGTTTPNTHLHINGGGARLRVQENSGSTSTYLTANQLYTTGGELHLNTSSTDNVFMVKGGGNVGIGTTDPGAKLDVNGSANFSGNIGMGFGNVSSARYSINSYTNLFLGGGIKYNLNGNYTAIGDGGSNYWSAIKMDSRGGNTGDITFYSKESAGGASYDITEAGMDGYEVARFHKGSLLIGASAASTSNYKLVVQGTIGATKIKVTQTGWSDYVFAPTYKLPTLTEVEAYINKYKHLPDVPSAEEVAKDGLDVGTNQSVLLKKIEELTLYVIEQSKELKVQKEEMKAQKEEIKALKDRLKM